MRKSTKTKVETDLNALSFDELTALNKQLNEEWEKAHREFQEKTKSLKMDSSRVTDLLESKKIEKFQDLENKIKPIMREYMSTYKGFNAQEFNEYFAQCLGDLIEMLTECLDIEDEDDDEI